MIKQKNSLYFFTYMIFILSITILTKERMASLMLILTCGIFLLFLSKINFKVKILYTTIFLILTGAVTIFPLFFFNLGIKHISLGYAGVLFYLAPTFHFVTSVFILNEELQLVKLISFLIIWIGIIIFIIDVIIKEENYLE